MRIETEIKTGADGRFHVYAVAPFGFIKHAFATMAEAQANRDSVADAFRAQLAKGAR